MEGGICSTSESSFEYSSSDELSTSILKFSRIPFNSLILSITNLIMACFSLICISNIASLYCLDYCLSL
jgi:hypothetical protein